MWRVYCNKSSRVATSSHSQQQCQSSNSSKRKKARHIVELMNSSKIIFPQRKGRAALKIRVLTTEDASIRHRGVTSVYASQASLDQYVQVPY